MDKLLKERYAEHVCTEKNQMEFVPKFYRISDKNEEQQLTQLIESNPQLVIIDEIESQLKELLKLKHPDKQLTSAELHSLVNKHVGNITYDQYGVWVYYPWRNTLVHLLDEKEFVEVRTNRNQYKITPEEEEILATKKIGIIGLSVGKAIALTMAMERICGEIVLADFDVIELSNLNRIQTGVHHFNTKKTVVAAREIAEIDPYLKVTCYHEGLTESNLNDFFTKDKKLDACIEVCDGLEVKILARQKAKELRIPVVMTTSDRGMTDVERFDLNPNRPIFHGLINEVEFGDLKKLKTNSQKVPIVQAILEFNNISNRLKSSMNEIGKTITTWPQLGSCVVSGGGVVCNVVRRILLDENIRSGRYYVDIDELIKNK